MKTSILIIITLASFFALPTTLRSQNYQYISQTDLGIGISDQGGSTFYGANVIFFAGTLINNVTIDAIAQTIRESGTLSLPALNENFVFHEMRQLPPVFPNPPQTIPGDLTLNVSFAGGDVAFDTGPQGLSYIGGNIWSFNGMTTMSLPVNVSYSLLTGNQTYSGSVQPILQFLFNAGSRVDVSSYPSAITLIPNLSVPLFTFPLASIASVTAANGFQMNLVAAPEPPMTALISLGVVILLWSRRRKLNIISE